MFETKNGDRNPSTCFSSNGFIINILSFRKIELTFNSLPVKEMVNTFIIRKSTQKVSYRETAMLLDKVRLNKQLQEAKQMINSIDAAIVISKKVGIKVPEQCKNNTTEKNMLRFLENTEWIGKVYMAYKKEKRILIYRNGDYTWVDKAPIRLYKNSKYEDKGEFVSYQGRDIPRKDVCLSALDERVISKNNTFTNHACVKMWVGYLDAFKYYFNCMRQECLNRGIKCMYESYDLNLPVVKPWWTELSARPFMASLMRKELLKNEPVWYEFIFAEIKEDPWFDKGYIWFGNLKINEIMDLIENGLDVKYASPKQKNNPPKKRTKLRGLITADIWVDIDFDP